MISSENLHILRDPTWLGFYIDGVYYGLTLRVHSKSMHFEYSYRNVPIGRKSEIIENQWLFTVIYKHHSPLEIVEIIKLAHQLYETYENIDTIEEIEEIVRTHHLSCVCDCSGYSDYDRLMELYLTAHHLSDDRFGLTYYFIKRLCVRTLRAMFGKRMDEYDDEDYYDEHYEDYDGEDEF